MRRPVAPSRFPRLAGLFVLHYCWVSIRNPSPSAEQTCWPEPVAWQALQEQLRPPLQLWRLLPPLFLRAVPYFVALGVWRLEHLVVHHWSLPYLLLDHCHCYGLSLLQQRHGFALLQQRRGLVLLESAADRCCPYSALHCFRDAFSDHASLPRLGHRAPWRHQRCWPIPVHHWRLPPSLFGERVSNWVVLQVVLDHHHHLCCSRYCDDHCC
mmetsp:Transcript_54200/g.152310  ORF Transcript_54200/g.152310 Transcript_54200/m.152310 type:complete len:211 (-) Transcript_54200:479-1111(-)